MPGSVAIPGAKSDVVVTSPFDAARPVKIGHPPAPLDAVLARARRILGGTIHPDDYLPVTPGGGRLGTLNLQSVTLTDGTPVSATFDSGLQFGSDVNAVPAPAGLLLGLIGAAGFAPLGGVRRRKLAAVA